MKYLIGAFILIFLIVACNDNKIQDSQDNEQSEKETTYHKVEVLKVEQANQYTYLQVEENENEYWIAVTKGNFEVGATYYYDSGLEMKNFESKDLGKTFDKVYFVQNISSQPLGTASTKNPHGGMPKPLSNRESIEVDIPDNAISIAELYSNKDEYGGKIAMLKGKVTKYNPNILGKNWIHIQDGTQFNGSFDLTLTTNDEAKIGDIILCEGKVILNKDFGAGYSYDIILENAEIIKN